MTWKDNMASLVAADSRYGEGRADEGKGRADEEKGKGASVTLRTIHSTVHA